MKGKRAGTQCRIWRSAWGCRADEVQVRPGRSSVTGDLRGDAERSRFRCVSEAKGRGAIVFLDAPLKQQNAEQLKEQCVGTQRSRRISTCGRRGEEGLLRLVAGHRRKNCVSVLKCFVD